LHHTHSMDLFLYNSKEKKRRDEKRKEKERKEKTN